MPQNEQLNTQLENLEELIAALIKQAESQHEHKARVNLIAALSLVSDAKKSTVSANIALWSQIFEPNN